MVLRDKETNTAFAAAYKHTRTKKWNVYFPPRWADTGLTFDTFEEAKLHCEVTVKLCT